MSEGNEAMAAYTEAIGHMAAGRLDEAVDAFRRSVDVDATFAMGYLGLGQAYDRQGKVDDAIVAVRKALELTPEDPLAHTSLSRLLQQKGLIEEAVAEMAISARLSAEGDSS